MNASYASEKCPECPARVVCRCLNISEEDVVSAITAHDLATLQDLRRRTGAGDGCTCCHPNLKAILQRYTLAMASC